MVKRILMIVFTAVCCTLLYGKQDWKLVWSDEFDYTGAPDNSKWSFDTQGNEWNWGNDEAQNYTPESNHNAWVEDGHLVIQARKEDYYWAADGETKHYTSARLRTLGKGDWRYGKVEVHALLPEGRGMWPAIWMLPSEEVYGEWPKSGELDIMENVGFDADKIHCNIHTEAYNHSIGTNKGNTVSTSLPHDNWHVYSMEWDAEKVIFFLDGAQVFRFDNEHLSYREWPFDQKFHLLLNIAVGGGWGGERGIDDSVFPQQMLVDYVHVYQMGEVEETPKDGVLTWNECYPQPVCEGESSAILIDTTGTGTLLYPEKFKMTVKDLQTGQMITDYGVISGNGMICVNVTPKEPSYYETTISYREGEGECEQVLTRTDFVDVFSAPEIATIDSVGVQEREVVLMSSLDDAPFLFSLDGGVPAESGWLFGLSNGEHTVCVQNRNGCVSCKDFYVNDGEPLSVEDPANGYVLVSSVSGDELLVSGATEGTLYRIASTNGTELSVGRLTSDGAIRVDDLPDGLYFVILHSKAYPFIKK